MWFVNHIDHPKSTSLLFPENIGQSLSCTSKAGKPTPQPLQEQPEAQVQLDEPPHPQEEPQSQPISEDESVFGLCVVGDR
jgi:hypothetical protein